MKHTPGPWRIIDDDEDHITITDQEQNYGAAIIQINSVESRAMMKANASLIAAAPEMLAALNSLANEASGFLSLANPDDVGRTNMQCLRDKINTAKKIVVRARGES